MLTEEQLISFWKSIKALEGTTVCAPEAMSNLHFLKESKENARKHDWLYHCTNEDALYNIIQTKEFWLRNLKLVNDKEEPNRIDVSELENTYYVACFTYENNVPREHWLEYGNVKNGILLGVKQDWFIRKATFLLRNNEKISDSFFVIYPTRKEAQDIKAFEQFYNNRIINPYYICSFDFYQIVYDDELKKNIRDNGIWSCNKKKYPINVLIPETAGIIKSIKGYCTREGTKPYIKDWSTEKEVRLKVQIDEEIRCDTTSVCYCPSIAVPLVTHAFNEIKIRFSPEFDSSRKENCIEKIKEIASQSKIEVIND